MTPRARTLSFSKQRIVAAYGAKDKNSTKNVNIASIKTQMAVINWENVLVPLDWMIVHLGLGSSTASIDRMAIYSRSKSSTELPLKFAAIEDRIMELLTETVRSVNGPIFIVSDYPTVYVEYVCYLFFPRLTAVLRSSSIGIYIIGTPDTQLTALELKQWKVNLLRTLILERIFAGVSDHDALKMLKNSSSGRIHVVALCATKIDVAATSTILSFAPQAVVKCAQVKSGKVGSTMHPFGSPIELEEFYTQLQTLKQFVKQAAIANQSINIEL